MASIGVPINLSKSVVASNSSFEFAKVTGYYGQNVSAISWKMFMSQPTMMGRVNIVYSLLNKDIIPSNLIGWVRNILSKSWYNKGDMRFSLIALLSMLTKSGKLPYSVLIGALIAKQNKIPKRLIAKNLVGVTNLSYMESLLSSTIRGSTIPLVSKKIVDYEETYFKNESFKQIKEFLANWSSDRVHLTALALVRVIFPLELTVKFQDNNYNDYLSKDYTDNEQCVFLVFSLLRVNLRIKFDEDIAKLTEAVQLVPNANGKTEETRKRLV